MKSRSGRTYSQMLRKIAILAITLYVLLSVLMLRWTYQRPTDKRHDDEKYTRETLEKLLVARHAGSPGHAAVRDFIDKELNRLGFSVKRNDFFLDFNYTNVVGFWNEEASHVVVLTCHYDGPMPRRGQEKDVLVSATDGAVSCAILLTLAQTIKSIAKVLGEDNGLVLAFFDGHESLAKNEPSLYGSQSFLDSDIVPRPKITLVMILNHIGAPNQTFLTPHKTEQKLMHFEEELRQSGQLIECHKLFDETLEDNDLPDDHLPFKENHIPILYIAPKKYPSVHHTAADNAENLHWPTILNMIQILREYISYYVRFIDNNSLEGDYYIVEGYDTGEEP